MSNTLTRTDQVMNDSVAFLDALGCVVTPLTQYELLSQYFDNVLIHTPEDVLYESAILQALVRVEASLT